jgi:hypothetical protein
MRCVQNLDVCQICAHVLGRVLINGDRPMAAIRGTVRCKRWLGAAHRPETDGSNGQRVRTNSLYDRAMEGGSIGGLRGVMIRTPESTRGTGRKAEAGTCRPRRNSHQGTHVVERRVEGGNATRFRATAHWTMRSARSRVTRGSSNRRRRTSVVYPNGREPTTRNGSVGRRKDRKSPSTTRTLC